MYWTYGSHALRTSWLHPLDAVLLFNRSLYSLYFLSIKIYFYCLIDFRIYYFSVRIFQINCIIFIRRQNNTAKTIILKELKDMLTLLIHPFQQFIKTWVSKSFSEYRLGQCFLTQERCSVTVHGLICFSKHIPFAFQVHCPFWASGEVQHPLKNGTPSNGHLRHPMVAVVFNTPFLKNIVWAHN